MVDTYTAVARQTARQLTLRYSSSFGLAARLFDRSIRDDIYAVYGVLRLADEIVDTYRGPDAAQQLANLEHQVVAAIESGYSSNLVVHAFAQTARQYAIGQELLRPFFASMTMDLERTRYDQPAFKRYVHGSAEVVGLMCLKVFCPADGDDNSDEF